MKIKYGDMFEDNKDDIIMVTTNAFIKNNGSLVMGRGAALEMKTLFPGIEYVFGEYIKTYIGKECFYGIYFFPNKYSKLPRLLGIFQVKYHFKDMADLELIRKSTVMLKNRIEKLNPYYNYNFSLNYPGIGNGRLQERDVEEIISVLPDNVTIWKLK